VRQLTPEAAARVSGAVLLAVGLLGFVPAITRDWSQLALAGRGSHAKLVGLFQVSVLLNLAHAALGAAGLALSGTARSAHGYLVGAGVGLLALWLLGVVEAGGWLPVDAADDWLHLALGVAILGLARGTSEAR
jgi:hypothetical protein